MGFVVAFSYLKWGSDSKGVKIGVCGFVFFYMYVRESAKHVVCSYVFLKYLRYA